MRFILIGLAVLVVTGCAKYPVVASFEDIEERYIGYVESNIALGTSEIKTLGEKSGAVCKGSSKVIAFPTWGIGCAGQFGEVKFTCDDGRLALGEYRTTSCTSGYGNGLDSKGNKFNFYFGDSAKEQMEKVIEGVKG
jgi:hypothetical protein